jgi:hypothetical protein
VTSYLPSPSHCPIRTHRRHQLKHKPIWRSAGHASSPNPSSSPPLPWKHITTNIASPAPMKRRRLLMPPTQTLNGTHQPLNPYPPHCSHPDPLQHHQWGLPPPSSTSTTHHSSHTCNNRRRYNSHTYTSNRCHQFLGTPTTNLTSAATGAGTLILSRVQK